MTIALCKNIYFGHLPLHQQEDTILFSDTVFPPLSPIEGTVTSQTKDCLFLMVFDVFCVICFNTTKFVCCL